MSTSRRDALKLLGVAGLVCLVPLAAEARVGGGQGFSSGRSSGGFGRRSGGSSGGGEADLIFLLIRLCIYYPEIGIPLLTAAIAWMWWNHRNSMSLGMSSGSDQVIDGHGHTATHRERPRAERAARGGRGGRGRGGRRRPRARVPSASSRSSRPTDGLTATDPTFSEPVLQDFLQLVYRRAWNAVSTREWDALTPFVTPEAQQQLTGAAPSGAEIDDVVVASVSVRSAQVGRDWTRLRVAFTSSRTQVADGKATRLYTEETWTFRRAAEARSLEPEAARRLGCPSCGAAVQTDRMGRCTHCEAPITEGQLQWQAERVEVGLTRRLPPPEVRPYDGQRDPSLDIPSVVDPQLAVSLRAFSGRHSDFDTKKWESRIHQIFLSLQEAWSEGRWDDARPHVTDSAWHTLGFWLDKYARSGLRNKLADVRILKMQVVKVSLDPWYETITVRFWADMRDWVERTSDGKVVGGNKKTSKPFSEYWSFIRAVGSGGASSNAEQCPSCGAPLDNINAAGVCGYCDSVITTGQFDWVLSRIDQVEVYEG